MDPGLVAAARAAIGVLLDLVGIDLSLTPGQSAAVEQPSGGYDFAPSGTRPSQRFKLTPSSPKSTGREESQSGIFGKGLDYILLGAHDSVAEVGDYWIDGNNRYVISGLLVANEFKKEFAVRAQGPGPNFG